MKQLNDTIDDFCKALELRLPLKVDAKGRWGILSFISSRLRAFFYGKEIVTLARMFTLHLRRLESIPIHFPIAGRIPARQPIPFCSFLQAAALIEKVLLEDSSKLSKKALLSLKRHRIALQYRLESLHGGLDLSFPERHVIEKLTQLAANWKKSQKVFWRQELSESDHKNLREACVYPLFIELLEQDPHLVNEFFKWTIRDGISPAPFVQFPCYQEKLTQAGMNGRIGKIGGSLLKISFSSESEWYSSGYKKKILTLPIEGRDADLLDQEKEVVLQGNFRLKIKDIFSIFRQKKVTVGNLEFFSAGILNWNAHRLGWWNATDQVYELIDLDQHDWWFQLPLLEILTLSEARSRYGDSADGKKWIVVAKATREYLNLHYDKSHAYLEVGVPVGKGYSIYDFGKVATHFPATHWEEMRTFTVTVLATIAYPDENVYYSQRQHVGYCFGLDPEEGYKFMELIRDDMSKAREGNVVFQIESENCGRWIQNHLEEHLGKKKVPNLFRYLLIEAEPVGLMGKTFGLIRRFPAFCRSKILALLHFPFGAWKGRWIVDKQGRREWKSLTNSSYWKDGIVYLPAYLHYQRERGVVDHSNEQIIPAEKVFENLQ